MSKKSAPLSPVAFDAPCEATPKYVVAHGAFVVLLDGARRELVTGTLVPDGVSDDDIASGIARGILAEV